ncbi:MAG: hypothetical protein LRY61_06270 [Burkholderiaceae bacterium]|nr:hypothetical protein [Burkholderiaceae bacterium]
MKPVIDNLRPLAWPDRGFLRGFVAAGCVSAFQDVDAPFTQANLTRVLRQGVQGGIALAAGIHAVGAVRRSDYGSALISVAAGAMGVYVTERLLNRKIKLNKGE